MGLAHSSHDSSVIGGLCGSCGMSGGCGCVGGNSHQESSYQKTVSYLNIPGLGLDFLNGIAKILSFKLSVDNNIESARKELSAVLRKTIKSNNKIQANVYKKIQDFAKQLGPVLPDDVSEGIPMLIEIIKNIGSSVQSSFESFKTDVSDSVKQLDSASEILDTLEIPNDSDLKQVYNLLKTEITNRKSALTEISEKSISTWKFPEASDLKELQLGKPEVSKKLSSVVSSAVGMNSSLLENQNLMKEIKHQIESSNTGSLEEAINIMSNISDTDFNTEKINSVINILSKIDYLGSNIMATVGGSSRKNNLSSSDEGTGRVDLQVKRGITDEDLKKVHDVKSSSSTKEQFKRSLDKQAQIDHYFNSAFYKAGTKLVEAGNSISSKIGSSIQLNDELRGLLQRFETLISLDRQKVFMTMETEFVNKSDLQHFYSFLGNLNSFSAYISKCRDSSKYRELKVAIDDIIDICNSKKEKLRGGSATTGWDSYSSFGSHDGAGPDSVPLIQPGFGGGADSVPLIQPGFGGGADSVPLIQPGFGGGADSVPLIQPGFGGGADSVPLIQPGFGGGADSVPLIQPGFGGGGISYVPTDSVIQGIYAAETLGGNEVYEGGNFVYTGGVETGKSQEKIKPRKQTVKGVSTEMKRSYKIAEILENLQSGQVKDIEDYGEEYKKMTTHEIAYMIDSAQLELNEEIKSLYSNKPDTVGYSLAEYAKDTKITQAKLEGVKSAHEYLLKEQFRVKKQFLRAVEAIDLYLRENTISNMKAKDSKEIGTLLGDVMAVQKWFSDKTGDSMANVFESFPSKVTDDSPFWTSTATTSAPSSTDVLIDEKHYYEWVAKQSELGNLPGNPNLGFVPDSKEQVENLQKLIKSACTKVRVIENILNLFDKIGTVKMTKVAQLGPQEVYRAIVDYVVMSSLSVGFNKRLSEPVSKQSSPSFWSKLAKTIGNGKLAVGLFATALVLGIWWLRTQIRNNNKKFASDNKYVKKAYGFLSTEMKLPKFAEKAEPFLQKIGNNAGTASAILFAASIVSGLLYWFNTDEPDIIVEDSGSNPDEVGIVQSAELSRLKQKLARADSRMEKGILSDDIIDSVLKIVLPAVTSKTGGDELSDISNMVKLMSSSGIDISGLMDNLGASQDLTKVSFQLLNKLSKNIESPALGPLLSVALSNMGSKNSGVLDAIRAAGIDKLMGNLSGISGGAIGKVYTTGVSYGSDIVDNMQVMMSSIPIGHFNPTEKTILLNGGYNNFCETDLLFEMTMKAIVSKVLVYADMCELHHKSYSDSIRPYAPVRLMLGAGSMSGGGELVKVISEAAGLYARLPLLCEFYRDFFMEKHGDETTDMVLAPEFGKLWSPFIKIVFAENHYSGTDYSDEDTKKLVDEINKLYTHFKVEGEPEKTERRVVNALVREMNRRYGFLRKNELTEFKKKADEIKIPKFDRFDEDGVETGETLDSKTGPVGSDSATFVKPEYLDKDKPFGGNLMKLWSSFSKFISKYVRATAKYESNYDPESIDQFQFKNSIENYRKQLKVAKDESAKYSIARELLQGSGKFSSQTHSNLLMFNELVVTPLAVLNAIDQVLSKFCAFAHGTNYELLLAFLGTVDNSKAASFNNKEFSGNAGDGSFASEFYKYLQSKFPPSGNNGAYLMMIANQMNPYLNSDSYTVENRINGSTGRQTGGKCRSQEGWDLVNRQAWLRFGTDRQLLFRDFIENLFSLGIDTNKLISVNMSSGYPIISYSGLQELCVRMLTSVKSAINTFRGALDIALIGQFESSVTGSCYWIEERLIKCIFNGNGKLGLNEANIALKNTFNSFKMTWNFDASTPRNPRVGKNTKDSFDDAMSALLYWNYKSEVKTDIAENMQTQFPDFYIPLFKSGSFDPRTSQEQEAANLLKQSSNGFMIRELTKMKIDKIKNDFSKVNSLFNTGSVLVSTLKNLMTSAPNRATFTMGFPLLPIARVLASYGEIYGSFKRAVRDGDKTVSDENDNETKVPNYKPKADFADKFAKQVDEKIRQSKSEIVRTLASLSAGLISGTSPAMAVIPTAMSEQIPDYDAVVKLGNYLVSVISILPVPDSLTDNKYLLQTFNIYKKLGQALRITKDDLRIGKFLIISAEIDKMYNEYYAEVDKLQNSLESAKDFDEKYGDLFMLRDRLVFYGQDSWKEGNKSLVVAYNELVAKLVTYCSDSVQGGRVYSKLFNEIAKSAHSSEVGPTSGGIKDFNFGTDYIKALNNKETVRFDIPGQSVMFATIGKAIQSILRPPASLKGQFSYQEIGEAPTSIIPIMQANLPAFEKLLELVALKATFLNSVVNTDLSFERVVEPEVSAYSDKFRLVLAPVPGVHGGLRKVENEASATRKTYFIGLLNQLTGGARAFEYSISETLGSIGGSGLYLETYSGFIKSYTSQNKSMPLMPLSSLTYFLNRSNQRFDVLPMQSGANDSKFKLLYGVRQVINKYNEVPRLEHMPGVKNISEKYAEVGTSVSVDNLSKVVTDLLTGLRFVLDVTDFKRVLGGELGARKSELSYVLPPLVQTYQYSSEDIQVVELTESSNVQQSIAKIVGKLHKSEETDDRLTLQIQNIIDLNIVPFNMNYMMREIPLVNIVNYSYTFDRIVEDRFRLAAGVSVAAEYLPARNLDQMYMKLLLFPYGQQSDNEYYALVSQIMTSSGDKRQKYLADQLWNKVLLNTVNGSGASITGFVPRNMETLAGIDKWQKNNKGRLGPYEPQNDKSSLTYVDSQSTGYVVKKVKVADSHELARLGKLRYDTKLVRTLNWMVLLHQMLLQSVVSSHAADPGVYATGKAGLYRSI